MSNYLFIPNSVILFLFQDCKNTYIKMHHCCFIFRNKYIYCLLWVCWPVKILKVGFDQLNTYHLSYHLSNLLKSLILIWTDFVDRAKRKYSIGIILIFVNATSHQKIYYTPHLAHSGPLHCQKVKKYRFKFVIFQTLNKEFFNNLCRVCYLLILLKLNHLISYSQHFIFCLTYE